MISGNYFCFISSLSNGELVSGSLIIGKRCQEHTCACESLVIHKGRDDDKHNLDKALLQVVSRVVARDFESSEASKLSPGSLIDSCHGYNDVSRLCILSNLVGGLSTDELSIYIEAVLVVEVKVEVEIEVEFGRG